MSSVSFSGLASGLDTAAIVKALVGVERMPIDRLDSQNANLGDQRRVVDDLSSALGKLRTAANSLKTTEDFLSYSGRSTDESIAKLTASGGAVPGTYKLEVTQLAKAQRTYSNEFASKTAALSASDQTLDLTIDGETTHIEIDANATLSDVAAAINGSGAAVTAGLFFDGDGYRLQVVGKETGAANAITFADSGLGLGLSVVANTAQVAQDAQFELDDFPVSSATNTITDALPGVSLELQDETSSPIYVSVEADSEAVKDKIQKIVDAYNEAFRIINAQSGKGKGTNTLSGDSTVRTIERGLQSLISGAIPGLLDDNGDQMSLGDLGIKTNRDGTLTIDETKLDEALDGDFAGAAEYFSGRGTIKGMSSLLDELVDTYVDGVDGLLTTRKKGINSRIADNTARMEALEAYMDRYEANLKNQFTQMEQAMSAIQNQQQYLARFLQG